MKRSIMRQSAPISHNSRNSALLSTSSSLMSSSKQMQSTLNYSVRKSPRIIAKTCASDRKTRQRSRECDENESSVCVSPTKQIKLSQVNDCGDNRAAKSVLSTAFRDSVVGRDDEMRRIAGLVGSNVLQRKSGALYISGAAGTGKTLTVNHVLNQLKANHSFQLIYINCMSVRIASDIYAKIAKELSIKASKSRDLVNAIKEMMTSKSRDEMIVLILDEIDQLESKSQQVIHNLVMWSTMDSSRVVLIGIANSLDFTDRILSPFKKGNDSVQDLHFMPYAKQEIVDIIEDRLKRSTDERNIQINASALQLCARKIASCSGDIRKALHVCRRAIDLVESNQKCVESSPLKLANDDRVNSNAVCVDTAQILAILNQVYGTKTEQSVNHLKQTLPFQQQIVLCALILFAKRKNLREVKLSECFRIFVNISTKHCISYDEKNETEFINMCQLLEDNGYVFIKKTANSIRNGKISLKVDENEIEYSMSDKSLLRNILQQADYFFK